MAIEVEQSVEVVVVEEEEDKEPTLRREALVNTLIEKVKAAKDYHEKSFKQMKVDMDAAYKG